LTKARRSVRADGEPPCVHANSLYSELDGFLQEVSDFLQSELAGGAEIPFELASSSSARGRTPLYCYRPLTGEFIRRREAALKELASYPAARQSLAGAQGADRYLLSHGISRVPVASGERGDLLVRVLLNDLFAEQSTFELSPARVREVLAGLIDSQALGTDELTILATLHGVALGSSAVELASGLRLLRPDALSDAPEGALNTAEPALMVLFNAHSADGAAAIEQGREVLADLLRALRLYADGRVTLGQLAWARLGQGSWTPLSLGTKGHSRGALLIATEQEDELRAFCNLVSRRAPCGNELAWALERFEMGCERTCEFQALSDYLLALEALLDPDGTSPGSLAWRFAALCVAVEARAELAEGVTQAFALERGVISGVARRDRAGEELIRSLAQNLRALLCDVICGHLDADLISLADRLLGDGVELSPNSDAEDDPWQSEQLQLAGSPG
jgi:hypothetical protein